MGWFVFATYVAVALWTWRFYAMRQIETDARTELERREKRLEQFPGSESWRRAVMKDQLVSDFDRHDAVFLGAMTGLFCPIFWVGLGLYFLFCLSTRALTAPTERIYEQRLRERDELEVLRKLAREHNLPMPGSER